MVNTTGLYDEHKNKKNITRQKNSVATDHAGFTAPTNFVTSGQKYKRKTLVFRSLEVFFLKPTLKTFIAEKKRWVFTNKGLK